MLKEFAAGLGISLVLAASGRAGTISYSHSESTLPVGSAGTFDVPQYSDPGGQPLIKVTLSVAATSVGGSHTFDNEAGAGSATVTIGTDVRVGGPIPALGAQLVVHAVPVNINSGPVGADSDGLPADFVGSDTISVTGTGSAASNAGFKTLALDIAPYQGAGLVTLDYTTGTSVAGSFSTTGGGANEVVFGTIRADYTATVTYEFAPEPASFALGALGLCSLMAIALRRKVG